MVRKEGIWVQVQERESCVYVEEDKARFLHGS